MNGKPLYKKIGNDQVYLSYANVSKQYPAPWTMWGGNSPGFHVGNIKMGPRGLKCPEDNSVNTYKWRQILVLQWILILFSVYLL